MPVCRDTVNCRLPLGELVKRVSFGRVSQEGQFACCTRKYSPIILIYLGITLYKI